MNNGFGQDAEIYSVSELNRAAKSLLEGQFPAVFVEGEISNFSRPASGHWYFTLKDDAGQLRTAMFRNRNSRINFTPANGLKVLVRGRISLYEARGDFQFIAENMQEAGIGELQRAFEALRRKLHGEGLFDAAKKRDIPPLPDHLAIITSATGAAIHDVMSVLGRRFPAMRSTLIPTQVQGEEATAQVVSALEKAAAYREAPFDLILLTRGGGSLEDLWTFNTEPVARAIAASPIPVVSAVGHESDVTIADFVADLRAPTPSAAAELIAPDQHEWMQSLDNISSRLATHAMGRIQQGERILGATAKRLRNPAVTLAQYQDRLSNQRRSLQSLTYRAIEDLDIGRIASSLVSATKGRIDDEQARLDRARERLSPPIHHLRALEQSRLNLTLRLSQAADQRLKASTAALTQVSRQLEALSPLKTLARGFSITQTESGDLVSSADQLEMGQIVDIRLSKGRASATITGVEREE